MDHALICYGVHYFALRVILLADSLSLDTQAIGHLDEKGRPSLSTGLIDTLMAAIATMPIAQEMVPATEGQPGSRLLDETFSQVVSHFRGYDGQ